MYNVRGNKGIGATILYTYEKIGLVALNTEW